MMKKQNLFKTCILLFTLIAFTACKKEDEPVKKEESTTAEIAVTRVNTPGGRVYYMGAYSKLPTTIDYRDMLELGASVTVYSYGEHPYVWNGNSSTLTKYSVSNTLDIKVTDMLSFASTGLSGFFGPPAFISETKAYFFVLAEGKVIEFNPTTMEITEVIPVTPLPGSKDPNINTLTYYTYVTPEGKILLPVDSNPGDFNQFPQHAQVAVFDPATKAVTYVNDDRMSMGYYAFAKDITNGDNYYRPSKNVVRAEDYSTVTGHPTTGGILKVKADGTFDTNFFVDLEEVLNAHCIHTVIYVYGTKALVQYTESPWTAPTDNTKWATTIPTKMALVDLATLQFENFTALSKYGTVYSIGKIDGNEYYANFGGTGDAAGKYYFLKQTGATDFEIVSEALGGSGIYAAKLR
jgi:hypothetical protein